MSETPRDPTDERDERIAALLQTEPLDDLTRTRLVRNAMTASAPEAPSSGAAPSRARSGRRWLAVAAAVVVVLAVGLAVFVRTDSDSEPSAARSSRTPSPEQLDTTAAGDLEHQAFSGRAASLGDLGDVSTRALLRRAATTATATATDRAPKASDEAAGAITALPQTVTTECVPALRGDVVAVGTGTDRGTPVTVYVVRHQDGSLAAVTVDSDCAVGKPVPL